MTRQTMLIAIMMAETAVLTLTRITALSVNVIFMKIVFLVFFHTWLVMDFVMMRPTMQTATMMVEIAVDTLLTLIFVLTVNAISMKVVLLVLIP